jgi:MFS family permease
MLRPQREITAAELAAGQRELVRDLAWASLSGAFAGGVILVACALSLGASPLHVGLLASIPFLAQALQLPATVLVERLRLRRRIAVVTITAARILVLCLLLLPLLRTQQALSVLIAAQVLVASLNAVGACAVNSWLHQMIPPAQLGAFFSRRLFSGTTLSCAGTLAAGLLVDRVWTGDKLDAYALAFGIAGLAGFVSSWHMSRAPEPVMQQAGPPVPVRERLIEPFADVNFRKLLVFLGAWTVVSNLAAPFLTVYLMQQRGYPLGTVTVLWVAGQMANALTLYLWGRLSDRFSNKSVLAAALPVHFACLLGLTFLDGVTPGWQIVLLALIHVVMGIASGGIALSTGNLGLKLAPQGRGTAYLAAIGLVSALAGGIAPLAGGWLAQTLQANELLAVIRWTAPGSSGEVAVLKFAHWEFVFGLAALLGLYVMHALSRVQEAGETSDRRIVQEFAVEALRSLGSLATMGSQLFPFERLTERRQWWRARQGGRS